jgi:hypothetical protein
MVICLGGQLGLGRAWVIVVAHVTVGDSTARSRLPASASTWRQAQTTSFPPTPNRYSHLPLYPYHHSTARPASQIATMADAAVENPSNTVPPHKKQLPSSIPNFDTLEGFTTDGNDDYSTFKKLQRQLE